MGKPNTQQVSRAGEHFPHRSASEVEDQIVQLRKELSDRGLDAGAETIRYHLALAPRDVPSVSTIWRVLRRRGFVTPQPHKRPRSSWVRFEARLPNERWQSDVTHWKLRDGTEVEICNFLDDHSRLAVGSRVMRRATAPAVLELFREAGTRWGFPAALLTDNGCVLHDLASGGTQRHADRALGPGDRLPPLEALPPPDLRQGGALPHQTMKRFLAAQPKAATIGELQAQVDRFTSYNEVRPHRGVGRRTPRAAFEARDRARPTGPKLAIGGGVRVRRDRIDKMGRVTLRHQTRLHYIGVGRAHRGTRVIMLIDGLDVRIVSEQGELLRHLTLDPRRDYQPLG